MSRTWTYQKTAEVAKVGEAAANWYAGWYTPTGKRRAKSFGPGPRGKKLAEKHAEKVGAELLAGTYDDPARVTWEAFREKYEADVLATMSPTTAMHYRFALDRYEEHMKPCRLIGVTTASVLQFRARRLQDPGQKKGETVSVATVNKDLRHLRAAMRKAKQLFKLKELPEFEFLREPKKLPTYVTPEEFGKLYAACGTMTRPDKLPYPAADWWRGLLVFAYMTGWRIGSILALRRADVDLEAGTALSQAAENKGKEDRYISLHPLVVEHLKAMPAFATTFFPFPFAKRTLYADFTALQDAAGVKPKRKDRYGFHDFRRAFATMNADRLPPDVLQAVMQHQDYSTTQRYINIARQLKPAAHNLFVPTLPGRPEQEGTA